MYLMDGKETAKKVRAEVKEEVKLLQHKPHLLVIWVGNDLASQTYVQSKEKACNSVGIEATTLHLSEDTSQRELIQTIQEANENPHIHAILVQMPLPNHLDEKEIINAIDPRKDVDGLHPVNQGKLMLQMPGIIPATPKGIMRLIDNYCIDLTGKKVIVIGRSMLVGKPLSILMLQRSATVTMAHSKTKNLHELTKDMDVIVSAVGKPKLITADMVKEGAIVIDVGINRVLGTIVGDVDYLSVANKTSRITPVPGGVGPMTIACLLENVVECYKLLKND